MTFALSGGLITQSGTDADLSGLSSIAGVNTVVSGASTFYFVGTLQIEIAGTLGIDPKIECLCSNQGQHGLHVLAGGVLNFGKSTSVGGYSYNSDGVGYFNSATPQAWYAAAVNDTDMALWVHNGGTLVWRGGSMLMPYNGFGFSDTAIVDLHDAVLVSGHGNADAGRDIISLIACAATGSGFKVTGGEIYFNPNFVGGSLAGITRQAATLAYDAAAANVMTYRDIDAGGRGNVIDVGVHCYGTSTLNTTIVGSVTGTALSMIGVETDSGKFSLNKGYISIRRQQDFLVRNIGSAGIENARVWIRDSNNGARKNLNAIDDTADKTYLWNAAADGSTAPQEVIAGIVNVTGSNARGASNVGAYTVDLRGKTNALGDDLFDVHCIAYAYTLQTREFAIKGVGIATGEFSLLADAAVTLTEAAAAALTSIATLDDLYCAAKLWKTRAVLAQLEYPSSTTLPAVANGSVLDFGARSIVVDANASAAFAIDTTTHVVTVKAAVLAAGSKFATLATGASLTFVNGAAPSASLIYRSAAGTSVIVAAPNLRDGTRVQVYDIDGSTELANTVISRGLGYVGRFAWSADKTVRLRASYCAGLSAMRPIERSGLLTSTGLTFLDGQVADDVYAGNAIDGSLVTEFVADLANVRVDIADPDGVTTVQRLYAWMAFEQSTASGVALYFGAIVAGDSTNYVIQQDIVDLHIDNQLDAPVRLVGGVLTRKDGSTVIAAASKSIQIDPGKAYVAAASAPASAGWSYQMPDGRTAAQVLAATNAAATEVWREQGLDIANPLVVSDSARTAGASQRQSISEAGGVVTVQRIA